MEEGGGCAEKNFVSRATGRPPPASISVKAAFGLPAAISWTQLKPRPATTVCASIWQLPTTRTPPLALETLKEVLDAFVTEPQAQ